MKTHVTRRSLIAATAAAATQTTGCRRAAPAEDFGAKVMNDIAAGMVAPLSYMGDRLGIFKAMAGAGQLTPADLARKTGLNERYMRAWLQAMTAAEYVRYDPSAGKFSLPPDHATVLADEESPSFMGGMLGGLVPAAIVTPKVQEAFRTGKGVPYSDYPPEVFESIARSSAPGFKHRLVPQWIPSMPQVERRLRDGGAAADVGCGQGVASIVMAGAFPRSKFWGFDAHGPSIERARAEARSAGLSDRVTFEVADAARIPERRFDFISTFDVLHDSSDPAAIVLSARAALAADGTYLASEPNLSQKLEENINPMGRMFYSAALLYCMSVSLAQGGAGIGADIHEDIIRRWGEAAGFRRIRRLPIDEAAFLEMRI